MPFMTTFCAAEWRLDIMGPLGSFLLGVFLGTLLGVVVMCLVTVGRDKDE
jgi:hypothetical protein